MSGPGGSGETAEAVALPVAGPPGRDAEAGVVGAAVDRLLAGKGGALLISGEGGVGKTTLSAWGAEHARAAGAIVLEAPCFALSTETPYAGLVAAFGPVLRAEPADHAGPVTRGLSSLGLLFDGIDWGGAVPAGDDSLARTRLHGAFATLVSRLSSTAPVLLTVDDLHWADPATLEVLQVVGNDLPDVALLIMATLRPYEAGERLETRRLLRSWRPAEWASTLDLGGLDLRATGQLVQRRLGGVVPARAIEIIHQRSGGTPLVAEELVEAMVETGALRPIGRRWDLASVDEMPVLAVADDLIGDRLSRLGGDAVHLIATVAVAGEAATATDLEAVSDRRAEHLRAELESLRRAGLIDRAEVRGETAWVVHHPIIGEVATAMVGDDTVAELHLAFAENLHGAGIERLGRHVLGAGSRAQQSKHVRLLLDAGRSALDRGAPEQAGTLLGAALDTIDRLDVGGGADLTIDVLAALGRAWTRRGEFRIAYHHLQRANSIAVAENDLVRRAEILILLHEAAWNGRSEGIEFISEYDELLAALEAAGEWSAAHRLIRSEFMRRAREGERRIVPEFLAHSDRVEAHLDDDEVRRWRRQIVVVGDLERFVDGQRLRTELDELLAAAVTAGDHDLERRVLHERLDVMLLLGSRDSVAAAVRAEREFGERWGEWPTWRIGVAAWDLAMAEGDLDRATEIEDLLHLTDHARPVGYIAVERAISGLIRGRPTDLPDVAAAGDDPVVGQLVAVARWWSCPGGDERERAAEVVRWSESRFLAGMPLLPAVTAALAFVDLGDAARFEELVAQLRAFDGGSGRTSAWASVVEGEAATTIAGRADAYADAGECFDSLGRPFDAAMCWLAVAEAGGEVHADRLAGAAQRFEMANASWLSARLQAAAGVAPAGATRERLDALGLTAREREVAEVVAEGLSNREVANRLYISVRTVTSHLDHIYTKLAIRSRTELTTLLQELAADT